MRISARNRLKVKIVDVRKGATTAHVRLEAGGEAYAIAKASDVMIGLDD